MHIRVKIYCCPRIGPGANFNFLIFFHFYCEHCNLCKLNRAVGACRHSSGNDLHPSPPSLAQRYSTGIPTRVFNQQSPSTTPLCQNSQMGTRRRRRSFSSHKASSQQAPRNGAMRNSLTRLSVSTIFTIRFVCSFISSQRRENTQLNFHLHS